MAAPVVYIEPNMQWRGMLLYGFAAALLGGINNPWGAVAGGFVVGVLENLAGAYVVGTELKLSVAAGDHCCRAGDAARRTFFGYPVVTRV